MERSTEEAIDSANEISHSNTLADDVAFLRKVLDSATAAEQDTNGENIASLVQQLDKATGVAQGVEGRLDKLLESLEQMISGLEERPAEMETKVSPNRSCMQSNYMTLHWLRTSMQMVLHQHHHSDHLKPECVSDYRGFLTSSHIL
jgi:DNA repair ATPase RecN